MGEFDRLEMADNELSSFDPFSETAREVYEWLDKYVRRGRGMHTAKSRARFISLLVPLIDVATNINDDDVPNGTTMLRVVAELDRVALEDMADELRRNTDRFNTQNGRGQL